MLNFIAHDTAILVTTAHARTKFALARLTSENNDERSVYQLCLSDHKLDSEESSLLQKASDRSFAVEDNRPLLKLATGQDHYTITDPQLITQFTYGNECYEVFAFEDYGPKGRKGVLEK